MADGAKVVDSPHVDELERAETFVETLLPQGVVLNVLAAEAGRPFAIRPPTRLVRCDVVQAEPGTREDADEHVRLDFDHLELGREEYDVVLFANVLEHVHKPLRLFPVVWDALKDNGIFVAVLPNVASVKGFVTRMLPTPLQRALVEFFTPTVPIDPDVRSVHSFSLRPSALLAAAKEGGWRVEYFRLYEGPLQRSVRERFRIVGWRWSLVATLLRVVTLGMLSPSETGIIAVFSKSGAERR